MPLTSFCGSINNNVMSQETGLLCKTHEKPDLTVKDCFCRLYSALKVAGIEVAAPYSSNGNHKIIDGLDQQSDLIEKLVTRIEVVEAAVEQDIDLTDNRGMFWVACRRFHLRPQQSFLDVIESDDVLEIYTLDFKQMFCSFNFWTMVSYTLDEVFSNEFWELYGRDSSINEAIGVNIKKALDAKETVPFDVPPHIMQELVSPAQYKFEMTLGYVSPLYDRQSGRIVAFASTLKAKRLEN